MKKLPTGLQASVFGEDLSPELLAALSLGDKHGIDLSTLALMHSTDWGLREDDSLETYLTALLEDVDIPRPDVIQEETRMNDGLHEVELLDGQPDRDVCVRSLSQSASCLEANDTLVVVGSVFSSGPFTRGLIAYGRDDGRFCYCENRFGELESSAVDVCPNNDARLDVKATNNGSRVFSVKPATLSSYAEFDRIFTLLENKDADVLQLLGLAKVAEDLGVEFAEKITGGDRSLLSFKFLREVHGLQGNCGSLVIPNDIESLVRQAGQALSLSDRKYEKTRFHSMRETIDDFLKVVESKAQREGNVGCQPRSTKSFLIQSCILDALGQQRVFAIFEGFKKSKLNIARSSGYTAIYFPGLNLSVAFPEGSGALETTSFRAACPFLSDLSLTLPILLDLALEIGKDRLKKVAEVLSKELAADPSLALSPLSENVLREFSTKEKRQHHLTDLVRITTGHPEATVGGVLCQLGMNFTLPPGQDSSDMRCYFDRCHELGWGRTRGTVGEVVVDCRISIEGCVIYYLERSVFLGTGEPGDQEGEKKCAEITGALSQKSPEDCLEAEINLLKPITSKSLDSKPKVISVRRYVG